MDRREKGLLRFQGCLEGLVSTSQTTILGFIIPLLALQFSFGQTNQARDAGAQQTAQKEEWQDYSAHLQAFKERARKALENELARAKAGDCPEGQTTPDTSTCLKEEVKKTTANYHTYADSLRSMEGVALLVSRLQMAQTASIQPRKNWSNNLMMPRQHGRSTRRRSVPGLTGSTREGRLHPSCNSPVN